MKWLTLWYECLLMQLFWLGLLVATLRGVLLAQMGSLSSDKEPKLHSKASLANDTHVKQWDCSSNDVRVNPLECIVNWRQKPHIYFQWASIHRLSVSLLAHSTGNCSLGMNNNTDNNRPIWARIVLRLPTCKSDAKEIVQVSVPAQFWACQWCLSSCPLNYNNFSITIGLAEISWRIFNASFA